VIRLSKKDILTSLDKRIIERLKKGNCGFNELCYDLASYTSRNSIRDRLVLLVKMGLVEWRKGRHGQKSVIRLTDSSAKFAEKEITLKTMWDDYFLKLKQLSESVELNLVGQKDAGVLLVWLIYEVLPLLATGLIESEFSFESRRKLSSFSVEKFCCFFDEILKLGVKYPGIRVGFHKGLEELSAHVKPIEDEIVSVFEQLGKLKAEKESGEK
jgi:DNA-binding HxlR family transcriptional regulator